MQPNTATNTELQADADPGGPICRACHAPMVHPPSHPAGWTCPYDGHHRVYYGWELSDPPLDAGAARQLEMVARLDGQP